MRQLHVGFARVDITPPVGCTMAGYSDRDKGAESIEQPLSAQALVLESGGNVAAIVCADLVGVNREIVAAVQTLISEQTGISPASIAICASHTHWGPAVCYKPYFPPHLREYIFPDYVELLCKRLAEAMVEAWQQRQPVCAGGGIGWAEGISFNRRPVGADGKCENRLELSPEQAAIAAAEGLRMRQGWCKGGDKGPRLSPPLAGLDGLHAGVSDPEVVLLRLETPDGAPLAGLVNFACHPVVGGDDDWYAISPDYPGEARDAFEAAVGAPMMFSLGGAGDQVPAWRRGDSRERVGRSLGAAAVQAWYQIEHCVSDLPLAVARQEIDIARKPMLPVVEAQAALEACEDPDGPGAGFERHQLAHAREYAENKCIPTELWAVRVGDWAAVGLPGEILTGIGLQIKQRSPFPVTAVITLCNDDIGYISTAQAHREGGYEPTWSRPGPEAERQVVDGALELLRSLA